MKLLSSDPIFISEYGELTLNDFQSSLGSLGVSPGDILMVHSRLFAIGKLVDLTKASYVVDAMIDVLIDCVGNSGTLIFPTFTLSCCRSNFFDLNSAKSEMGVISETARLRHDSLRTNHPFFSVALIGGGKNKFLDASLETCFGKNSIFGLLHENNKKGDRQKKVKFLTIGIENPPDAITYIHFIEERMMVPYRYYKFFDGIKIIDSNEKPYFIEYFARNADFNNTFNGKKIWALLKGREGVHSSNFGNSTMSLIDEDILYNSIKSEIKKSIDYLYSP